MLPAPTKLLWRRPRALRPEEPLSEAQLCARVRCVSSSGPFEEDYEEEEENEEERGDGGLPRGLTRDMVQVRPL